MTEPELPPLVKSQPRETHPRWPLAAAGMIVAAWILLALVVAAAWKAWSHTP